jgi:hypothetical protein
MYAIDFIRRVRSPQESETVISSLPDAETPEAAIAIANREFASRAAHSARTVSGLRDAVAAKLPALGMLRAAKMPRGRVRLFPAIIIGALLGLAISHFAKGPYFGLWVVGPNADGALVWMIGGIVVGIAATYLRPPNSN